MKSFYLLTAFLALFTLTSANQIGNCTAALTCNYRGVCDISKNYCICNDDYVTEPAFEGQCNTKVRSYPEELFCSYIGCETSLYVSAYSFDGNCSVDKCNYRGLCNVDNTACVCNNGYITFNSHDGSECNYKQKNTLTAFLLQFFLIEFGVGQFYLGNNVMAAGQIVYFFGTQVLLCICSCIIMYAVDKSNAMASCFSVLTGCLTVGYVIGMVIWWIYELVTIGNGNATDGNGAPVPSL